MYSLLALSLLLVFAYRWYRGTSLTHIRGPPPEFFFGNVRQLMRGNSVDVMSAWKEEFGGVIRYQSLAGTSKLIISDPKALQHILNVSAYDYPKPTWLTSFVRAVNGPDIISSEGDMHRRQRKIMQPAFGAAEAKALCPAFQSAAERLVTKWQDIIVASGENEAAVMDVHVGLSGATLDAISSAAFDFRLDNEDTKERNRQLLDVYHNFNADAFPPSKVLLNAFLDFFPAALVEPIFNTLPVKQVAMLRKHKQVAFDIAAELVAQKRQELSEGRGQRDVFSLLLKANASGDSNSRMADEEVYAQMSSIFVAGHDTTANTLSFALCELARRPDMQARLRTDIRAAQAASRQRGRPAMTLNDIENIEYLQAFLKEVLRRYPIVFHTSRMARKDDVVPLSTPIEITSGERVQQIHVPKGTEVFIAIGCYNRDKGIWGEDADDFKPERWLKRGEAERQATSLGLTGNLMSFLSGPRGCIGWRFAMAKMQIFLVELVNHFEFGVAYPGRTILQFGDNLTYPVMDGKELEGASAPLRVSPAPAE
ncbi:cytochrome P450 [Heliocybe sulcata]|uniref:Cytochrome P450 n=1 Tax=Heliocybe sulcata TaxID=5364 RepID=A0A5C3MY19_9AGAM|nr:cytochrome P450 [Heliocybe sulcata]